LSIIIIIIICSFSTIDSLPVDFFLLRLVGCTQPWGSANALRATKEFQCPVVFLIHRWRQFFQTGKKIQKGKKF
jgi:hypothetical protein